MSVKTYIYRVFRYIFKGVPNIKLTPTISYIDPSKKLEGKKIIITGGSSGIGAAMAQKFCKEGAEVLIVGRNEAKLSKVAEKTGCSYLSFDINRLSEISEFFETIEKRFGQFNTLVNNAGISLHESTFFDVTPETFDKQLTTNLEAPFFLAQEFINRLLSANEEGNILFISSETGDTVDFRPYGYTKAAINSVTKGLANLFKQQNIRINAISPGITASSMTGISANDNLYAGNYGSGRFYLPEEIAEVATFLISDASKCISGQVITCNNAQTVNPRWK